MQKKQIEADVTRVANKFGANRTSKFGQDVGKVAGAVSGFAGKVADKSKDVQAGIEKAFVKGVTATSDYFGGTGQTTLNKEADHLQQISRPGFSQNSINPEADHLQQVSRPGTPPLSTQQAPSFGSVNASATGVSARTPVDAAPGSLDSLFQKSKASTLGSPKTVLKDGVYLPAGGALTGGMVNVGDIGSPQAGAMLGSNFTGQPSMYPVQQSAGNDIFGDTDALIRRRDELQAGMDRVFAKNPMGNDLMANFHTIASQANQRKEIREIGDRLAKRDDLVAQLFGIGMQGQNQMNVQGLQNKGQLDNTKLGGQLQQQNTGLINEGQMAVQDLAGKQGMDRSKFEQASSSAQAFLNNSFEDARLDKTLASNEKLAKGDNTQYKALSDERIKITELLSADPPPPADQVLYLKRRLGTISNLMGDNDVYPNK